MEFQNMMRIVIEKITTKRTGGGFKKKSCT